jgi:hypothetical protein
VTYIAPLFGPRNREKEFCNELDIEGNMIVKRIPPVLLVVVGLAVLFPGGGRAVGQERKVELKETYHETFNGPESKYPAWGLYGPQAKSAVKFEPEGIRVQLPAGAEVQRPALGVATRVSMKGDFQITARYEILQEPKAEEVGKSPTQLTMDVVLAAPHNDAATLSRRVVPRAGKQFFAWLSLWDADGGKSVPRGVRSMPAKATKGRLRIERTGTNVAYLFAEGDDDQFTRVSTAPFSAGDVAEVRLVATTSGAMAALDGRFHDIEIRGEKIAKPPTAPLTAEFTPPPKDYAQEYRQSFNGAKTLPAGWDFMGPFAESCIYLEAAGLRINLPSGWEGERPRTGIKSRFGVKGDFDISLAFEILVEPGAPDAGKLGTRLSLGIYKETPHTNVATVDRSIGMNDGTNFVSWQSLWNDEKGKGVSNGNVFRTTAKMGRLRLVRSGPHLYYGFAEGPDGQFRFRARYNFGPEELGEIRIMASTGGEQAALESRVTDFRIRADAISNAPAEVTGPAAEAAIPRRGWLLASLLIGAVTLVVVVAAFFLTRARKVSPPPAKEAR